MPTPFSLDPDDVPTAAIDGVFEASAEVRCRRCGDPVAAWRRLCPSCGAALGAPSRAQRAIPVAPPSDEELPFAREVDVDDPFDVPVAEVITDRFGVPLPPRRRRRLRKPATVGWHRLVPMLVGYGVMMAVSVAFGVLLLVRMFSIGEVSEEEINWGTFAIEAIDAVIVLCVAVAIGKFPSPPIEMSRRFTAWITGFPLLSVLLALNIGSVLLLRKAFDVEGELGPPITAVTLLLICVQPAIVEEWFFRHLALGSLREKFGTHWAVWISAAMFAAAHIYNPIAMPYLLLLGVSLGYLRILSGGLALPMLLHFLHNLAVLYANRVL